jgi:hypothetical protein
VFKTNLKEKKWKKKNKEKKKKKNGKNPKFDIRNINWSFRTIYPAPRLYIGCECVTPTPPETQNTEINNL